MLKGKKTFCSHNGIEWVQLPEVSGGGNEEKDKEVRELVKGIRARFSGDLSFEYTVEVVVTVQTGLLLRLLLSSLLLFAKELKLEVNVSNANKAPAKAGMNTLSSFIFLGFF